MHIASLCSTSTVYAECVNMEEEPCVVYITLLATYLSITLNYSGYWFVLRIEGILFLVFNLSVLCFSLKHQHPFDIEIQVTFSQFSTVTEASNHVKHMYH